MNNSFLIKVFIAAMLGIAAGFFIPQTEASLSIFTIMGQIFLRALTLMVVPLVVASIITGTMRLGEDGSLGKLGVKILITFFCTMAAAVAIGLASVLIFEPGTTSAVASLPHEIASINSAQTEMSTWAQIEKIFYRVIPTNVFFAASQGEILGVILFSSLFGIISAELGGSVTATMKAFWEAVFKVMIRMTQYVMYLLPFGVFGLLAKAVATTGADAFIKLGSFTLVAALAFAFYGLIFWPLILVFVARVNPWKHVRAMFPALLTGFTTSSSAATLPVALECVEKGSGVSNRVSSLVLSLGIAVNLSASALYAAAVVAFIAQLTGTTLPMSAIAFMYVVTLFTSFGMAGIPSASLIVIVLVLQTLNIPADHLALIIAVERLVDMFRTALNVFANSCCAVVVARLEGEKTAIALGGKDG